MANCPHLPKATGNGLSPLPPAATDPEPMRFTVTFSQLECTPVSAKHMAYDFPKFYLA